MIGKIRDVVEKSVIILCVFLLFWSRLYAQQDTTKAKADTTVAKKAQPKEALKRDLSDEIMIGEIELIEITIEAVVEKPRVSIMPKRLEPKLEEMEFIDRSFEHELKAGPDKPLLVEERAQTPDKIEHLKDKIKKKENDKKPGDNDINK